MVHGCAVWSDSYEDDDTIQRFLFLKRFRVWISKNDGMSEWWGDACSWIETTRAVESMLRARGPASGERADQPAHAAVKEKLFVLLDGSESGGLNPGKKENLDLLQKNLVWMLVSPVQSRTRDAFLPRVQEGTRHGARGMGKDQGKRIFFFLPCLHMRAWTCDGIMISGRLKNY